MIVVSGKSSADHSRQKGGRVIHTRALFMKMGLFAWEDLCVVTSQQGPEERCRHLLRWESISWCGCPHGGWPSPFHPRLLLARNSSSLLFLARVAVGLCLQPDEVVSRGAVLLLMTRHRGR